MKAIASSVCISALCLLLPGCNQSHSPASGNQAENAALTNASNGAEAEDDHAKSVKSILRPEVQVDEETEAERQPLHETIAFGTSGLSLDEKGRAAIDALLKQPVAAMGGAIILRGHTDSRGADGDNRVASRIRAEAVRNYLVGKGVPKDRIEVIPLGEARPIAPNAKEDGSDDPEGRARNRRVEIEIRLPDIAADPKGTDQKSVIKTGETTAH